MLFRSLSAFQSAETFRFAGISVRHRRVQVVFPINSSPAFFKRKFSSFDFRQRKICFIAGSEIIFHSVFFRLQRKISRAVQMPENHFADAVFFEQLRKPRFRRTQRKRRIMNQGDKLVALFQKRLTAIQRQTETFAFAAVKFFVLDRKSTRLNSSHMPKSRMPSTA